MAPGLTYVRPRMAAERHRYGSKKRGFKGESDRKMKRLNPADGAYDKGQ